eukprot:CAMPEP_0194164426 /NCGR_PEP_ID=MMETSP0154-20130528/542_1 /TAXON_ID=1049557 /ORGANISM="Thalassiothrix antarctica, Strain L6-D1" /LENGTH=279 /DNA_ID=CAMNT_0038874605 /DNA_START=26 /DNA_END=862 /DNA_ORIENTATION=+
MKFLSAFIFISSVEAFTTPEFQPSVSTQLDVAPYPRLGRPTSNGEKLKAPAYAPNTSSGFGHAYGPPEIVPNNSQPRPGFFGAGAQRAKALLSRTKERAYGLRENSRLNRNQNGYENQKWIKSLEKQEEIVKTAELLMLVQERTNRLRETLRERANQNEYEILQLQVDLKKQEGESRNLKRELAKTRNEFEFYKFTAHEEQLALQQTINKDEINSIFWSGPQKTRKQELAKTSNEFEFNKTTAPEEQLALQHTANMRTDEISAVEADAKQLCDMLDELI